MQILTTTGGPANIVPLGIPLGLGGDPRGLGGDPRGLGGFPRGLGGEPLKLGKLLGTWAPEPGLISMEKKLSPNTSIKSTFILKSVSFHTLVLFGGNKIGDRLQVQY